MYFSLSCLLYLDMVEGPAAVNVLVTQLCFLYVYVIFCIFQLHDLVNVAERLE